MQYRLLGPVRERNIVKIDGTVQGWRRPHGRVVGSAGLGPHDLENPLETHAAAGHPDTLLGHVAQRSMESAHVVNEHVQIARRQLSTEHFLDAEPDNGAGGQRADDVHTAHVLRLELGLLDRGTHALGAFTVELLLLKGFTTESLEDAKQANG